MKLVILSTRKVHNRHIFNIVVYLILYYILKKFCTFGTKLNILVENPCGIIVMDSFVLKVDGVGRMALVSHGKL